MHLTSGGDVYWATSDGYVGRLGAGRITGQLDPSGVIGIDGVPGGPVWVVTDQGYVSVIQADGGVGGQQDYSGVLGRAYSLEVTSDGVFIGAFGGIGHRRGRGRKGLQCCLDVGGEDTELLVQLQLPARRGDHLIAGIGHGLAVAAGDESRPLRREQPEIGGADLGPLVADAGAARRRTGRVQRQGHRGGELGAACTAGT